MRITGLRATPVAVPVRQERWAYGDREGLVSVLLEIDTDEAAGFLEVPAEPGTGVQLDRERIDQYAAQYRERASQFTFGPGGRPHSAVAEALNRRATRGPEPRGQAGTLPLRPRAQQPGRWSRR